jgi:hypothetical protein
MLFGRGCEDGKQLANRSNAEYFGKQSETIDP